MRPNSWKARYLRSCELVKRWLSTQSHSAPNSATLGNPLSLGPPSTYTQLHYVSLPVPVNSGLQGPRRICLPHCTCWSMTFLCKSCKLAQYSASEAAGLQ